MISSIPIQFNAKLGLVDNNSPTTCKLPEGIINFVGYHLAKKLKRDKGHSLKHLFNYNTYKHLLDIYAFES